MKIALIVFLTLRCVLGMADEVRVTKAMERETIFGIKSYFSKLNKSVQDIWGFKAVKCEAEEDCLFFIEVYTKAQSNSYKYLTHQCYVAINKVDRRYKFIEDRTECELIEY